MDREALLDAEVAHRLGDPAGRCWHYTSHSLKKAQAASSDGLVHWSQSAARLSCPKHRGVPDRPAVVKGRQALAEAQASGLDFDILIDMQDARSLDPALRKVVAPILCFNRLTGATGRVLWPMEHIHGVGTPEFAGRFDGADSVPFPERQDKFVWRGNINGSATGPTGQRRQLSVRSVLDRQHAGQAPEEVQAALRSFARVDFVCRFADHQAADVGLTTRHDAPALAALIRPGLTQAQMAQHRYIVVLPGADLATSFFWTMASGSLGFVMEHDWQSFASVHFRPWEHFVPVRRDFSDFEDGLHWARSHPAKAEAMARKAQAVMAVLNDRDYRNLSNRRVIDGLRCRIKGAAARQEAVGEAQS